LIGW
jgi:hypothetical protein